MTRHAAQALLVGVISASTFIACRVDERPTAPGSRQEMVGSPVSYDASTDGRRWMAIGAGYQHTCALDTSGAMFCWGANCCGQLGNGSFNSERFPRAVVGGLVFASLSVGGDGTCALTPAAVAYCWGYGGSGQNGDGQGSLRTEPYPVVGGHSFSSISHRGSHTCGLTTAGEGYCWGYNGGWIGFSTVELNPRPTLVTGGFTWSALEAGGAHSCALVTSGQAYCWGDNLGGMLGIGTFSGPETCREHGQFNWPCSRSPVPVTGGVTFASLSLGGSDFGGSTCGITTAGAAYCWGLLGGNGQLGADVFSDSVSAPVPVGPGIAFRSLSAGYQHACGVAVSDDAYCWGSGTSGQLGNGQFQDSSTPVLVAGGHSFASVTTGHFHTCGVTTDGEALCWGAGSGGQLGSDSQDSTAVPQRVAAGYSFAGFFPPIQNHATGAYVLNAARPGSAIPVKFTLGGDRGLDIFVGGVPASEEIPCSGSAVSDGLDPTLTAGGSGLSYDATTNQYKFIWKTDRTWTGCRQLVVRLQDGTTHRASFVFSK